MKLKETQTHVFPQTRFRTLGLFLLITLLTIACVCFFAALWYVRLFGHTGFDSVLFTLFGGMGGTQASLIHSYLREGLLPAILALVLLCLLLFFPFKKMRLLFPLRRVFSASLCLAVSLIMLGSAAFQVQLPAYITAQLHATELYQKEYKDPNITHITFPKQKRNLIYIYLESMETTYFSKEQGGALNNNRIPNLYSLAQNNINISHQGSGTVGGFSEVPGASWTVGAMVAQTSGVPLKTPPGITDWQNGYGQNGVFLPGLTTLSDILHKQGYYQALMVGSKSIFGGRHTYYSTHGTDCIYDIFTAQNAGIVPPNYYVWWGMEDQHLFEYAKQELPKIAAQDQPFAFTMLTVDTHFPDGYKCALCGTAYSENFDNVISCSDKQIVSFIEWLKTQSFFENTTVILTGDHCSMDNRYFSRNIDTDYDRHIYNCFINAPVSQKHISNRHFSSLDLFPTTLAAMGCKIQGNRLGLGTNLFSGKATLIEKYGYDDFCAQLSANSPFYAEHFYDDIKRSVPSSSEQA